METNSSTIMNLDQTSHSTVTATSSDVTTSGDVMTTTHDPFYVHPGFPTFVFDISAAFMIVVGIIGVIANFSIIVLFMISPHVSWSYLPRAVVVVKCLARLGGYGFESYCHYKKKRQNKRWRWFAFVHHLKKVFISWGPLVEWSIGMPCVKVLIKICQITYPIFQHDSPTRYLLCLAGGW